MNIQSKNRLVTDAFNEFCKDDPVCQQLAHPKAQSIILTPKQVKHILEQAFRSGADCGIDIVANNNEV